MKKMKKSMFFSSILMIVVLVVALSTSTFAWYTSSSKAEVTSTTLYSATSGKANISIGWLSDDKTTSITFASQADTAAGLSPMILTENPAVAETATYTDIWHTAQAQIGEGGTVFGSGPSPATPWRPEFAGEGTAPSGYNAGVFYVNNWNIVSSTTIEITVKTLVDPGFNPDAEAGTAEALDLTPAFRLAIWTQSGADALTFQGIYAKSDQYAYFAAPWISGAPTGSVTTEANQIDCVPSFTGIVIPKAVGPTAGSTKIFARAWLDGTVLNDQLAGRALSFELEINAADAE